MEDRFGNEVVQTPEGGSITYITTPVNMYGNPPTLENMGAGRGYTFKLHDPCKLSTRIKIWLWKLLGRDVVYHGAMSIIPPTYDTNGARVQEKMIHRVEFH